MKRTNHSLSFAHTYRFIKLHQNGAKTTKEQMKNKAPFIQSITSYKYRFRKQQIKMKPFFKKINEELIHYQGA